MFGRAPGSRRAVPTCALVSNGDLMKGSRLGPAIDAHHLVMRLNDAPTVGYEADVGARTTVRFSNSNYEGFREQEGEAVIGWHWNLLEHENAPGNFTAAAAAQLKRVLRKRVHPLNDQFMWAVQNSSMFLQLDTHVTGGFFSMARARRGGGGAAPPRARPAPPPAPRPQLLELFHDTTYQTSCGQLIDLITAPIGVVRCARRTQPPALAVSHAPRRAHRACPRAALALTPGRATQVDLSKYTIETYMRIVTYKTAFYTFYLPAASAMHLCGITDEAAFTLAREVCMRLGQFFQIQDDYLDCYGDPAVIGKVGTDIEDNKCSWLVVQALARCTPAQRSVFEARHAVALPRRRPCADAPRAPRPPALPLPLQHNYGQNDPVKVAAIKAVYAELKMEAQYQEYEASAYAELCTLIQEQSLLPKGLFMEMLAKIYKRVK